MSTVPFHEPTSVFMRSNSGEPGLGCGISAALRMAAPASNSVAQTDVIFVFIVFLCFSLFTRFVRPSFTTTTNGPTSLGHHFRKFFEKNPKTQNPLIYWP